MSYASLTGYGTGNDKDWMCDREHTRCFNVEPLAVVIADSLFQFKMYEPSFNVGIEQFILLLLKWALSLVLKQVPWSLDMKQLQWLTLNLRQTDNLFGPRFTKISEIYSMFCSPAHNTHRKQILGQ